MTASAFEILQAPKRVLQPARPKAKSHPSHREYDFEVECSTPIGGELTMMVRVNAMITEKFSLGLIFHPDEGRPVMLLRVNDHHPHPNPDGTRVDCPHMHSLSFGELHAPPAQGVELLWAVELPANMNSPRRAWEHFRRWACVEADSGVLKLLNQLSQPSLPFGRV